jgi:hypothetical protein
MSIDSISPKDRGVFLVRTQGSEHTWEIEDDGTVHVTRESARSNPGLDHINGRRNYVTAVDVWPTVGNCFLYFMGGDVPWTRSSTIREIERVR